MSFVRYEEGWLELFQCVCCDMYVDFGIGDYGDEEIEVTAEEWEAHQAEKRTTAYLLKRYKGLLPKDIRDYWQR